MTHGAGCQWSNFRKHVQLVIITLAAIVPDFDSGIGASHLRWDRGPLACLLTPYLCDAGIAAVFALAKEYDTNPGVINNLTSK